jgi:hypothetical protein
MTVNSMDERLSTEMTLLVRTIDTGMVRMDGDRDDGDSETGVGRKGFLSLLRCKIWCLRSALGLTMGILVSPCTVLIAMSIEVTEMCRFSGGVERGNKLGGLPNRTARVCKLGTTGAGG